MSDASPSRFTLADAMASLPAEVNSDPDRRLHAHARSFFFAYFQNEVASGTDLALHAFAFFNKIKLLEGLESATDASRELAHSLRAHEIGGVDVNPVPRPHRSHLRFADELAPSHWEHLRYDSKEVEDMGNHLFCVWRRLGLHTHVAFPGAIAALAMTLAISDHENGAALVAHIGSSLAGDLFDDPVIYPDSGGDIRILNVHSEESEITRAMAYGFSPGADDLLLPIVSKWDLDPDQGGEEDEGRDEFYAARLLARAINQGATLQDFLASLCWAVSECPIESEEESWIQTETLGWLHDVEGRAFPELKEFGRAQWQEYFRHDPRIPEKDPSVWGMALKRAQGKVTLKDVLYMVAHLTGWPLLGSTEFNLADLGFELKRGHEGLGVTEIIRVERGMEIFVPWSGGLSGKCGLMQAVDDFGTECVCQYKLRKLNAPPFHPADADRLADLMAKMPEGSISGVIKRPGSPHLEVVVGNRLIRRVASSH